MSEAKHSPAAPVPASVREALEKITGSRDYDLSDFEKAFKYKREEGLWTVDEYLADVALAFLPAPEAAPTPEEIAKIIDPDAKFEDIDGVQWSKFELQRRELAYQKADAILALKAAPAK